VRRASRTVKEGVKEEKNILVIEPNSLILILIMCCSESVYRTRGSLEYPKKAPLSQ
jgi:hypothetical protein